MSQIHTNEALATIASAVNETHDGLASFTEKLKNMDDLPTFWWEDHPVWVSETPERMLTPWPLSATGDTRLTCSSPGGAHRYTVMPPTLRAYCDEALDKPLTDAEFALFTDLAAGMSLEDSALRSGVALSTRRKQLQVVFRKLGIATQAELVSLANRVVSRFAAHLEAQFGIHGSDWAAYLPFLPKGVRCGRIEGLEGQTVRYLEIGPASGRPVIVLHPMIFPDIDPADVTLMQRLGLRTIWPIRTGCLDAQRVKSSDWQGHSAQTVHDIRAIHAMCADTPVPIVALVSSGAYATAFARAHPECVARVDFVSTCFSSGKAKSRDVYFGDFLLRSLRQNGRMAMVAMQHLAGAVFKRDQLEPTMRRVFRGSTADQALLDEEFGTADRSKRVKFALKHSVESMRLDYFAQLNFSWKTASGIKAPVQFWHGAQDCVHNLEDLTKLALTVSGKPPEVLPQMGHLTQGKALRQIFEKLAAAYAE